VTTADDEQSSTTRATPAGEAPAVKKVALEVEDLAGLKRQLEEKGVAFKSGVIRGPRCQMAVCIDSEGNSLLLHQLDRPSDG
jgi:hypothetical protein